MGYFSYKHIGKYFFASERRVSTISLQSLLAQILRYLHPRLHSQAQFPSRLQQFPFQALVLWRLILHPKPVLLLFQTIYPYFFLEKVEQVSDEELIAKEQ